MIALKVFTEIVRVRLRATELAGGWDKRSHEWALLRLREELQRLEFALQPCTPGQAPVRAATIASAAADVAAFALVIFDNTRSPAERARWRDS